MFVCNAARLSEKTDAQLHWRIEFLAYWKSKNNSKKRTQAFHQLTQICWKVLWTSDHIIFHINKPRADNLIWIAYAFVSIKRAYLQSNPITYVLKPCFPIFLLRSCILQQGDDVRFKAIKFARPFEFILVPSKNLTSYCLNRDKELRYLSNRGLSSLTGIGFLIEFMDLYSGK